MQVPPTEDAPATPTTRRGLVPRLLIANAVYLLAVQGWTVVVGPSGTDFARLSATGWDAAVFAALRTVLGNWAPGYHLLNLLLLWACMLAVFFITRRVVGGAPWLASLAAVLFMAHPLKRASTLALSGTGALLAALVVLLGALLVFHGARTRGVRGGLLAAAGIALALVPLQFTAGPALPALAALVVLALALQPGAVARLGVPLFGWVTLAMLLLNKPEATGWLGYLSPAFQVLYPLGLLPGTVSIYAAAPPLLAVASVCTLLAATALAWCVRSPVFTAALWATAFSTAAAAPGYDPAQLLGGGPFLLPCAFGGIAVAALTARVLQHPKWVRPAILYTTLLCVVLFAVHTEAALRWWRATDSLATLQAAAAQTAPHDACLLLAPGLRHVGGAPVHLRAALEAASPWGPGRCTEVRDTVSLHTWLAPFAATLPPRRTGLVPFNPFRVLQQAP